MTAPAPLSGGDARTQLAEVLPETLQPVGARLRYPPEFGEPEPLTGYGAQILDALLPTVERIADERAAEARRAEFSAGTTVLADLLRLTYGVQLDAYPSRAAREESERVADAFRDRINQHCNERNRRAASLRAASRGETAR